jgi:pimeloyl-ACP methyl ester carboxylesterase
MRRAGILLLLASCACAHASREVVAGQQGRLYVDDGGAGKALPLLLVHGNGANSTQWRDVLAHERESRRAVAFDLRGMGLSDPAKDGNYSVDAMADDIDAVATALGLARFVLVGHSYGSHVVAAYAARHPDRVAAVVHVDGGGNVRISDEAAEKFLASLRQDKDAVVAKWFAPILAGARPSTRRAVLASVHATSIDAFAGALDGLRYIDLTPLIAAYDGPRLCIFAHGLEGPNSLHVQFPKIPSRGVDGVSHWLMMDKPEEFDAILDEFLRQLPQ